MKKEMRFLGNRENDDSKGDYTVFYTWIHRELKICVINLFPQKLVQHLTYFLKNDQGMNKSNGSRNGRIKSNAAYKGKLYREWGVS